MNDYHVAYLCVLAGSDHHWAEHGGMPTYQCLICGIRFDDFQHGFDHIEQADQDDFRAFAAYSAIAGYREAMICWLSRRTRG